MKARMLTELLVEGWLAPRAFSRIASACWASGSASEYFPARKSCSARALSASICCWASDAEFEQTASRKTDTSARIALARHPMDEARDIGIFPHSDVDGITNPV